ncbi:MAG: outer membrane lipoprotein carrier protein LolA [Deltaproteobacteria bacterium]|nr:outer membrane lipoprotein carrier protein LolA [Deltaproteobacteria bacterium]
MNAKAIKPPPSRGIAVLIAIGIVIFAGKSDSENLADAGAFDEPVTLWLDHIRTCRSGVFSIQANFTQELLRRLGPKEKPDTGIVKVRRGGRVRLRYDKPSRRLIVSDGNTLWAYDPASKTVIKGSAGRSLMPRLFNYFLDDEPGDSFVARHLGGAVHPEDGSAAIELVPKERDPVIAKVVLTLRQECPCVQRVLAIDHTGAVIRVTLDKIRTNIGLGKNLFTFKPPPGTSIIRP